MSKVLRVTCQALVIFTTVSLAYTSYAGSSEEIEFELVGVPQMAYDPFSGLAVSENFVVKVRQIDSEGLDESELASTKNYKLIIRDSMQGTFELTDGQNKLPFLLMSKEQSLFEQVGVEYHDQIVVQGSKSEHEFTYQLNVPRSKFAVPGTYETTLQIELRDMQTDELISDLEQMDVVVVVDPKLQTNLAGTRGNYEDGSSYALIDFGKLEAGESKQVFIQVRGNAPALISVSSENGGRMKHQRLKETYINYFVDIDGESSQLTSPLYLKRMVAKELNGSAYPMKVTIDEDIKSSFAGEYRDIITIDVSPQ